VEITKIYFYTSSEKSFVKVTCLIKKLLKKSISRNISTVMCGNCGNQQKFRESNVFNKEVTKKLISRNISTVMCGNCGN